MKQYGLLARRPVVPVPQMDAQAVRDNPRSGIRKTGTEKAGHVTTHTELCERLAARFPHLPQSRVNDAVAWMLHGMAAHLATGGDVQVLEFGRWSLRYRPERNGRVPGVGLMAFPEKNIVHFASPRKRPGPREPAQNWHVLTMERVLPSVFNGSTGQFNDHRINVELWGTSDLIESELRFADRVLLDTIEGQNNRVWAGQPMPHGEGATGTMLITWIDFIVGGYVVNGTVAESWNQGAPSFPGYPPLTQLNEHPRYLAAVAQWAALHPNAPQ